MTSTACTLCGADNHNTVACSWNQGLPDSPAAIPAVQLHTVRAGRIYVAGPMTGLPEFNYPSFNAEADRLRAAGWHVENPADHGLVEGAEWADYLRYDIGRMATCEAIHLLPGWQASRGAQLEHHIATALGMQVHFAEGAEPAPAQDEREECRCPADRRLVGEGCRVCNLEDDIHQLAFEVGDPAEDASGYWFDMESFNELVGKLLPLVREPYEDALRSLASYVGAGGYNAPTVDPAVFEQKIRWGIDQLTRPAQTDLERESSDLRAQCGGMQMEIDELRAAQTAPQPEQSGLPLEPTEAMLDAYWEQTGESVEMRTRVHSRARKLYAAMARAALSPTPSPAMAAKEE